MGTSMKQFSKTWTLEENYDTVVNRPIDSYEESSIQAVENAENILGKLEHLRASGD